jgi:hypothetical protein
MKRYYPRIRAILSGERRECIVIAGTEQNIYAYFQLRFVINSGGFEPLTYHWTRNGEAISESNDPDLELFSLTVEESGDYVVEVADDLTDSTTSLPATLVVSVGMPAANVACLLALVAIMVILGAGITRNKETTG